jgi:hypothetical protein
VFVVHHRRRLEALRSPGRDRDREEGSRRPDRSLRGLTLMGRGPKGPRPFPLRRKGELYP